MFEVILAPEAQEFFASADPPLARKLARWAASAKVNQDDWTEAMVPTCAADEIEYGITSEQDVIAAIDRCLKHFATLRRAT